MKQLSFVAVAAACAAAVIIPGTALSQDAVRKVKIDVTSTYDMKFVKQAVKDLKLP